MPRIVTNPKRPYTTPCDEPLRPCPACGGLECLCRPRFFAGQLLTDEDLTRLDHYIVAKNKLRNRYLHGTGVVCGLEVVCHPCNMVAVHPGFAISPCGEDIVVCDEQVVDVCALISACRKPKRDDCAPIDAPRKDACEDTIEKWVLAVSYEEKPSRGVTPLRGGGSACCSKCAGGGSGSCGCKAKGKGSCSCHGSSAAASSAGGCGCGCHSKGASASRKPAAAQCEPTIVCEGFRFEVCLLPPPSLRDAATPDQGALIERIMCCVELFQKNLPSPPAAPTLNNLKAWCCDVREHLADLFASHPGHSCLVAEELGTMCTDPGANVTPAQYQLQIVKEATKLLARFLQDCFCSALLPPCPAPVDDDRVYLATITVRRKDCRILEICNWDQRHFAITWPMIRYWLSPLPFGRQLKAAIAKICCVEVPDVPTVKGFQVKEAVRMNSAKYPLTADAQAANVATILAESAMRVDRPVHAGTIALASFGAVDAEGHPLLSEAVMRQPAEAFLVDALVRPVAGSLGATAAIGAVTAAPIAHAADLAAMQSRIASMQSAMDEQQRRLDDLSARLNQR